VRRRNVANASTFVLVEDGSITASLPPDPDQLSDVTDGIEKSMEEQDRLQSKS
jgi:hypothetical protein